MYENLIYLSVLLSVWSLKLNAQDIDFPLLQSEIEKYESRVHIQRLPNVYVTHPDAYKIRTQQPVYPSSTKRITLDVINVDAPTAEPELHWMKYRKGGEWKEFPSLTILPLLAWAEICLKVIRCPNTFTCLSLNIR